MDALLEALAEKYAVNNEQATLNIERLKSAVIYGMREGIEQAAKVAEDPDTPVSKKLIARKIRRLVE